jgi:hypothetical protein
VKQGHYARTNLLLGHAGIYIGGCRMGWVDVRSLFSPILDSSWATHSEGIRVVIVRTLAS